MQKKVKVLVAQSCLTLCNPMDYNPPGSSVYRISQARILELVAISISRDLPHPAIEPSSPEFLEVPCLQCNAWSHWLFVYAIFLSPTAFVLKWEFLNKPKKRQEVWFTKAPVLPPACSPLTGHRPRTSSPYLAATSVSIRVQRGEDPRVGSSQC